MLYLVPEIFNLSAIDVICCFNIVSVIPNVAGNPLG
jgi:hypothetical protein